MRERKVMAKRNYEKAVSALMACPTAKEAAKAAGIGGIHPSVPTSQTQSSWSYTRRRGTNSSTRG
jgi:hypothetical protein